MGEPEPDDAVLFVGVSLVLGIASRHLLRGTRVPYTVALLVLGVALGSLEYGTQHGLGKLGAGIRICKFLVLRFILILQFIHSTWHDAMVANPLPGFPSV
jgi:hypothetical protein